MDLNVRGESASEFKHDLDNVSDALPEEMAKADRDVAEQVAKDARAEAYSIGGVAAHVAPSIETDGAEVRLGGGPQWAMAAGAEFGRDDFAQFKPYTGSGDSAGYFLYPAIERTAGEQIERYAEAADDALGKAFR